MAGSPRQIQRNNEEENAVPTADRKTLRDVMAALVDRIQDDLVSDPPTTAKPFRRVAPHAAGGSAYPRPFIAAYLLRARPVAATDDDRIFEATIQLRIIADAAGADAHGAILNLVESVEDEFDALRDGGVIEGCDGFDVRAWEIKVGEPGVGARMVSADAAMTCMVRVARGENR